MNTQNNTILITGGGSGIGLELARQFSAQGNRIIIIGRNEEKLYAAIQHLDNVDFIRCDVTLEQDVIELIAKIKDKYPRLNMLINNSGSAFQYSLAEGSAAVIGARKEMEVNYFAPIRLTELLLPVLSAQPQAAIVNVTSVVAIVPWSLMPTYSASKAALQSYTRLMRLSLVKSNIKVFEVIPPLVDTDFSKNIPTDKMSPADVATAVVRGVEADNFEIRIGFSEYFYTINKQSPEKAFNALNGLA